MVDLSNFQAVGVNTWERWCADHIKQVIKIDRISVDQYQAVAYIYWYPLSKNIRSLMAIDTGDAPVLSTCGRVRKHVGLEAKLELKDLIDWADRLSSDYEIEQEALLSTHSPMTRLLILEMRKRNGAEPNASELYRIQPATIIENRYLEKYIY